MREKVVFDLRKFDFDLADGASSGRRLLDRNLPEAEVHTNRGERLFIGHNGLSGNPMA